MKRLFLLIFLLLPVQEAVAQETPLDRYVQEGIEGNLALKQQEFSLLKSMQTLRQARGLFLPSVTVNARYSRAGGGRMIDFPVGDLVNPMQTALNQLLEAQGQPAQFPANVPNVNVPFLRKEEQDTKIETVQPLFNGEIYYNYRIQESLRDVRRVERDVYKRQLVSDIKTAYFRYLIARHVLGIYEETELLLNENLRVSRSLVENQTATRDVRYRAEAELSGLLQKKADAEKNTRLAAAYFNFLLNRPLDATIEPPDSPGDITFQPMAYEEAAGRALRRREEFAQLESAIGAAEGSIGLANSAFLPSVTAVLDYGVQGEQYRFTNDDDYWMLSFVGEWNLFNGFRSSAQRQQAILDKKTLEAKNEELKKQIELQVKDMYESVLVSEKKLTAAHDHLESARQTFTIVERKFREGMASNIEFIDARTTKTNAEINRVTVQYQLYIQQAELERVTASFNLSASN